MTDKEQDALNKHLKKLDERIKNSGKPKKSKDPLDPMNMRLELTPTLPHKTRNKSLER